MRQMATFKTDSPAAGGRSEEIESIFETRATGFCVHALVLGSLALLPQLGKIPMAVVSGIFLYLGRKVGLFFVRRFFLGVFLLGWALFPPL